MRTENHAARPTAYNRKKQPEAVRRNLLDSAARLIAKLGTAGASLQAIAEDAGVTKGALFHHFANKEELFKELLKEGLSQVEERIAQHIKNDPVKYGSFTRAYINVAFEDIDDNNTFGMAAYECSKTHDGLLRDIWEVWSDKVNALHKESDNTTLLEIARYAVQGAWTSLVFRSGRTAKAHRLTIRNQILNLTYKPAAAAYNLQKGASHE